MVLTPLCPTRYAAMRQKDEEEGVGRGCSAPQMGCSAGPREHDGESGPSIICLLRDTDTWALFSNLFLTCPPSFLPSFLPALPPQTLLLADPLHSQRPRPDGSVVNRSHERQ